MAWGTGAANLRNVARDAPPQDCATPISVLIRTPVTRAFAIDGTSPERFGPSPDPIPSVGAPSEWSAKCMEKKRAAEFNWIIGGR